MLDLNQIGIFVETADRKEGKVYIGVRTRESGSYLKCKKFTLIICISSNNIGERRSDRWLDGGTTNDKFIEFLRRVLNDLPPCNNQHRRCFIMDNLNTYYTPLIYQLITNTGHQLIFRALYYAVYSLIEYLFNRI